MFSVLAITNLYPTACNPFSGTFVEQQITGLRRIGVNVELMFIDRISNGMRAYAQLGRRVYAQTAKLAPDLVHVMYGGVMADVVTRVIKDRPTVVSFCGSDLLGENLSGAVRRIISRYGVVASHRAARRATGIVVKSRNLERALPLDIPRTKVRTIPNGVDLEKFRRLDRNRCRQQLGWDKARFHVLFPINGGDPVKRPDLACASVNCLAGFGIKADIHFLKGVMHASVPTWINASDVVLLTSLQEGSPNIIKEALACDVPVVSVDVGDVGERLSGIDGCFLSPPDADALAAKLRLVYNGPRRVAGRRKMEELSLESIAMRLANFYGSLLPQSCVPAWS